MSTGRSTSSSDSTSVASPDWLGFAKRWLPVVVWATFISWFSTDAFSARSTNSYIDPVLRFFFPDLTRAGFRLAHSIIRKTAHFTEYAILAVLICRALADSGGRLAGQTVVRALIACVLYAVMDEAHQALVPSRTGSGLDVVIDITGATTGALFLTWSRGRRARRNAPLLT